MSGRIVAAVTFENSVYIFTEWGHVYEMYRDQITNAVRFRLIHRIPEL